MTKKKHFYKDNTFTSVAFFRLKKIVYSFILYVESVL